MNQKIIAFNKTLRHNKFPEVKVGDIVRVHRKIKEGQKERIQVFKGLVIAIKGKQSSSPTITVRRVSGDIGIEMIFPIFSPVIEKIEILRHSKIRRSKLYYMRERFGKAAKMKAIELSEEEKNFYNKKKEDEKTSEDTTKEEGGEKKSQKEKKEDEKVAATTNKTQKKEKKEDKKEDKKEEKKEDKKEEKKDDKKDSANK